MPLAFEETHEPQASGMSTNGKSVVSARRTLPYAIWSMAEAMETADGSGTIKPAGPRACASVSSDNIAPPKMEIEVVKE